MRLAEQCARYGDVIFQREELKRFLFLQLQLSVHNRTCIAEACFFTSHALDPTQFLFDFSCVVSCQNRKKRRKKRTLVQVLACLSHLKRGLTRFSPSLQRRSRPVSVCAARKKKGKCGCMKMQKALVFAQKTCVSLCFQIIRLQVQLPCFSFRPPPHNITKLLVRFSPVGVTREVPVKPEHLNNFTPKQNKRLNSLK